MRSPPVRRCHTAAIPRVGRRPGRTITVVGNGDYIRYDVDIDGTIREVLDAESGQDSVNGNTFSGAVNRYNDRFTCDRRIELVRYKNVNTDDNTPDVFSNYNQVA